MYTESDGEKTQKFIRIAFFIKGEKLLDPYFFCFGFPDQCFEFNLRAFSTFLSHFKCLNMMESFLLENETLVSRNILKLNIYKTLLIVYVYTTFLTIYYLLITLGQYKQWIFLSLFQYQSTLLNVYF